MTHWLVKGASAASIESSTGLRAIDTPLGALVERPRPFRIEVELERLDRALHPRRCRCVVVHMPPCRFTYTGT